VARVCVFDVNETLLDLRALDGPFEAVFGEPGIRQLWFGQMLQSALVSIVTDRYSDFGAAGGAALEMIAARRGMTLSDEQRDEILSTMRRLPAHPDVVPALDRLDGAGFRLATLTNSTEAVAIAQLTSAGLADRFERIFSADTVMRLKPAPEPYRMAAAGLGVGIDGIRLIAAHAWDIAGALRAGAAAAFVSRPGMVLDPLVERPDVVGRDLDDVAAQIIALESNAGG
jgi:2-haloacid dehalogenase